MNLNLRARERCQCKTQGWSHLLACLAASQEKESMEEFLCDGAICTVCESGLTFFCRICLVSFCVNSFYFSSLFAGNQTHNDGAVMLLMW